MRAAATLTLAAMLAVLPNRTATVAVPDPPEYPAPVRIYPTQRTVQAVVISDEPVPMDEPVQLEVPESVSLGEFKITVYTPASDGGIWGYQTATGVRSEHLATCAVDPSVIPLGSVIEINGLELAAVDVGGLVKGNVIDVFFDGGETEALAWAAEFGTRHEVRVEVT